MLAWNVAALSLWSSLLIIPMDGSDPGDERLRAAWTKGYFGGA